MIHLITYSDCNYNNSKERLIKEAVNTKWFNSISSYGPEDLDIEFKNKFKDILDQKHGAGYWIWKPYVIKKKINEINDGDILIYLDAGCSINICGKERFDEYCEKLNISNSCIISFQMPHIEKQYTVKEIFDYFNLDYNGEIANTGQIVGGILIMKKNKDLINLIDLEMKLLYDNPLLFTNYYNKNQDSKFKDNRHDQSVFSIIRKINNPMIISDETYFKSFGNGESLKYPFWATRKKK